MWVSVSAVYLLLEPGRQFLLFLCFTDEEEYAQIIWLFHQMAEQLRVKHIGRVGSVYFLKYGILRHCPSMVEGDKYFLI